MLLNIGFMQMFKHLDRVCEVKGLVWERKAYARYGLEGHARDALASAARLFQDHVRDFHSGHLPPGSGHKTLPAAATQLC